MSVTLKQLATYAEEAVRGLELLQSVTGLGTPLAGPALKAADTLLLALIKPDQAPDLSTAIAALQAELATAHATAAANDAAADAAVKAKFGGTP